MMRCELEVQKLWHESILKKRAYKEAVKNWEKLAKINKCYKHLDEIADE